MKASTFLLNFTSDTPGTYNCMVRNAFTESLFLSNAAKLNLGLSFILISELELNPRKLDSEAIVVRIVR